MTGILKAAKYFNDDLMMTWLRGVVVIIQILCRFKFCSRPAGGLGFLDPPVLVPVRDKALSSVNHG